MRFSRIYIESWDFFDAFALDCRVSQRKYWLFWGFYGKWGGGICVLFIMTTQGINCNGIVFNGINDAV